MQKDFDRWNELKKVIENKNEGPFCNVREIWWCSLGLNVGSEEDGKNEIFERPVLILNVFNRHMVRVMPLTSKLKNDPFHFEVRYHNRLGSAIVSQMKTISTKRLSRKIGRIPQQDFDSLLICVKNSI